MRCGRRLGCVDELWNVAAGALAISMAVNSCEPSELARTCRALGQRLSLEQSSSAACVVVFDAQMLLLHAAQLAGLVRS